MAGKQEKATPVESGQPLEGEQPQAEGPGAAEVRSAVEDAQEKGYFGVEADPTPNEHYTVQGVTSGAPTPETDLEHAERVRRHVAGVERF